MKNVFNLNEKNINSFKTKQDNCLVRSSLFSYQNAKQSTKLSIKMVIDGVEQYKINTKKYNLNSGEFLLVENKSDLEVSFDGEKKAEGLCFFIDDKYLKQSIKLDVKGEHWGLDNFGLNDVKYSLLNTKYRNNQSSFGKYLTQVGVDLHNTNLTELNEDFFMDFTNRLLINQYDIFGIVNKLQSKKISTKQELYRRVVISKEYINDNIGEKVTIEKLTAICGLSEVQLHRSFKQIMGLTPYKYQQKIKLEEALRLIQSTNMRIQDISFTLGFTDLPTFSKSFKNYFGLAPTNI